MRVLVIELAHLGRADHASATGISPPAAAANRLLALVSDWL